MVKYLTQSSVSGYISGILYNTLRYLLRFKIIFDSNGRILLQNVEFIKIFRSMLRHMRTFSTLLEPNVTD